MTSWSSTCSTANCLGNKVGRPHWRSFAKKYAPLNMKHSMLCFLSCEARSASGESSPGISRFPSEEAHFERHRPAVDARLADECLSNALARTPSKRPLTSQHRVDATHWRPGVARGQGYSSGIPRGN